jgi:hypothetical protein
VANPKVRIDIEAGATGFAAAFSKITSGAKSAAKDVKSAFSGVGGALAGIGAGVSVAGFSAIIKGAVDAADKLNDLSKATGVGATTIGGIGFAAQQAGTDIEGVAKAFGKLNLKIADALAGNGKAIETFQKLGVSVEQLRAESASQIFARLADSFSQFEDGADKAAGANELFGKSYQSVLPLLDEGGESLRKNIDYFQRYSGVTDDLVRASDQFNDTLTKLKLLQGAFTNELVARLLPGLQKLADELVTSKENGNAFAETADRVARGIGVIATAAGFATESVINLGDGLGGLAAAGVAAVSGDLERAKSILRDIDEQERRRSQRFAAIGAAIDRFSGKADGIPESLKDTRGGPPPGRGRLKAPSFGDPGKSGKSAKKEVDEFDKALERVNKTIAESEEALASAFSGKELTGAQKALASLMASDEWKKFTEPQKAELQSHYERADAIQRETEAWKKNREETEKQIEAYKKLEEEQQKAAEAFTQDLGRFADDTSAIERSIALVGQDQLAHDKLIVTLEKEALARRALTPEDRDIVEEQYRKRIKALEDYTAAMEKFNDVQMYNQIFADNVVAIADGTKSIKEAFADMERSIVQAIARIAAQKLGDALFGVGPGQSGGIGSMLSGLFSGGGGGGGFDFSSIFGSLLGLFGGGGGFGMNVRARGGPVAANTPYLVGENEPELFVPNTAGTIIPGHKLGGGGVTQVLNFHVNGNIDTRTQRQMAREARMAISGARD